MSGETKNDEDLATVIDIANRNLARIFGPGCELSAGKTLIGSIDDARLGEEKKN